ncbi:MAG: hypothetical protein O3A87_07855 [Verrucomicrobia bacterium]|nr:hypothetical protein [Verrucomicrobiota bacterium]MDA1006382.1 hypothetical protein [Verrucomicrobiota bacterium]
MKETFRAIAYSVCPAFLCGLWVSCSPMQVAPSDGGSVVDSKKASDLVSSYFVADARQEVKVLGRDGVDVRAFDDLVSVTLSRRYSAASTVIRKEIARMPDTVVVPGRDPSGYFTDSVDLATFKTWPHRPVPESVRLLDVSVKEEQIVGEFEVDEMRWKERETVYLAVRFEVEAGNLRIADIRWKGDQLWLSQKLDRLAGFEKGASDEAIFELVESLRFDSY